MIPIINGSWFEFKHNLDIEGKYWNHTCLGFSATQWREKIREMAELGMEYLVLMGIAYDGETFYPSQYFNQYYMDCQNPLEAFFQAASEYNIKVFVSNDFLGYWRDPEKMITDPEIDKKRQQAMEEVVALYSHYQSFYGWYWPNEAELNPYYSDEFIRYVNDCTDLGHQLLPGSKTLIAPYGTNKVIADDHYAKQLEQLNVDVIAYQDEVGVQKSKVGNLGGYFENLKKVHDKVGRSAIWADVEIFEFEHEVYKSALIPASFTRIKQQLDQITPFVDKILVYQYLGMMNSPDTEAFAGHLGSEQLYNDYAAYLKTISSV
jgi:hypothetical protein